MLQLNKISELLTVNDCKIYTILIVSLTGIFLWTLIGEKAFAISSDFSFTNPDNNNLFYKQIGRDGSWTLTVYATNPPFGTDSVKVSVNGPYGYKEIKWATVMSENTRVNIDIPAGEIPVGTQYKVCAQTTTTEIIFDRNCDFFINPIVAMNN